MTTPCAGKPTLFESVRPDYHQQAAALCAQCHARAACLQLLEDTRRDWGRNGPQGTWAGLLIQPRDPDRPDGCGTLGGYYAHRRGKGPICADCREAWNIYQRTLRLRQGRTA